MALLTLITSGLLRAPVCHEGDWVGVWPWPQSILSGRSPDGAKGRAPSEKAGKTCFSVHGRSLIIRQSLKRQPHGVQSAQQPHYRSQNSRVQRGHQPGVLLVSCHSNHLQTSLPPRCQTTLSLRRYRRHPSTIPAKVARGGPTTHGKIFNLV